jgi:hypothetical protein
MIGLNFMVKFRSIDNGNVGSDNILIIGCTEIACCFHPDPHACRAVLSQFNLQSQDLHLASRVGSIARNSIRE